MVGKPISILAPKDRPDEIPKILEKLRKGEKVNHFESVRIAKDGRTLNVSITVSPIRDARSKVVGASAIARDITALKKTQRTLQESELTSHALFEAAAQAIFIVDEGGKIVMANPATEKLFGYAPQELLGKSVDLLVPEPLRRDHVAHRERYFAHPQNRPMGLGMDLQARRKDGTEFFAEISLASIRAAQGTLGVAFVTDISKRRADQEAIQRQREDLRTLARRLMTAQDEERRRIARNLHDDLSQQLAHLSIDLGKIANEFHSEEKVAQLRKLQRRAADAGENVRQISHQLHPSILEDIGLSAALEQYCEEFAERSGIQTHFISRNVPDTLSRDVASCLYHIAQECLRNVSKHSKAESVFVTLEAVDNVLRLAVKDQGIGLDAGRMEPGASIGLVGIKERAQLVHGTLSIQSQSGIGTEVDVKIPLSA